jgi:hypothetical protein
MTPIIGEFMPQPPVDVRVWSPQSQTNHRSAGMHADEPA